MDAVLAVAVPFLHQWEGLRLEPYRDTAGFWTVGYGHLISTDRDADPGGSITPEEADRLFLIDLARTGRSLARLIKVPLDVGQAAALLSFTFNLGGGKLQISTLRSLINQRRYEEAAEEFPKWKFVGGNPSKGVLRRRYAERTLFLGIT